MRIFTYIIIGCFLFLSCDSNEKTKDQKPLNIILIVADDQGYADLSCSKLSEDVSTPHLDRLAESGTRFTQAYATSPICSPSRAGILTGCYQQRWGTYWYGGKGIHNPEYPTIAEVLKKVNYKTAHIGKVHYGSYDSDTNNRSFPLNHGFDYFMGHTSARKHYLNHRDDQEDAFMASKERNKRQGQSLRQQALWRNQSKIDTTAFSTQLFAQEACNYIEENQNDPFFLQLSFNAVHNFTHQLPKNYLEEHHLNGIEDWDPAKEEYYEWYQKGRYPNNPIGRELYLGQLHFLDQAVGQVLDKLDDLEIREQTMIIYISDNGGSTPIYANNYPLRGSKYLLLEGGIRVPLFISLPGKIPQSVNRNDMISAMDIFPSICDFAQLECPEHIDGNSLKNVLSGSSGNGSHDTLIWDTGHEIAIRGGSWKYHLVKDDQNAKYEMVEIKKGAFLYNLKEDEGESTNLIDQYPDIADKLIKAHQNWKNKITQK